MHPLACLTWPTLAWWTMFRMAAYGANSTCWPIRAWAPGADCDEVVVRLSVPYRVRATGTGPGAEIIRLRRR
jgi:hypothetical protein